MITNDTWLSGNIALGFLNDIVCSGVIVRNNFKYGLNIMDSTISELAFYTFALSTVHIASSILIYGYFERKMEFKKATLLSNGLSVGILVALTALSLKMNHVANAILILGAIGLYICFFRMFSSEGRIISIYHSGVMHGRSLERMRK